MKLLITIKKLILKVRIVYQKKKCKKPVIVYMEYPKKNYKNLQNNLQNNHLLNHYIKKWFQNKQEWHNFKDKKERY